MDVQHQDHERGLRALIDDLVPDANLHGAARGVSTFACPISAPQATRCAVTVRRTYLSIDAVDSPGITQATLGHPTSRCVPIIEHASAHAPVCSAAHRHHGSSGSFVKTSRVPSPHA